MAGEQAFDEQQTDPIIEFKIYMYFSILDITTSVLKKRFFGDCKDNIQKIGKFKDLFLLTKKKIERGQKGPIKYFKICF